MNKQVEPSTHRSFKTSKSLVAIIILFFIALMIIEGGCYSARIATKHVVTRDTLFTVSSLFWGAIEPQPLIGDDTRFTAMWDVEVYQTVPQRLGSFFTLGIWSPITVHGYFAVPDQTIP